MCRLVLDMLSCEGYYEVFRMKQKLYKASCRKPAKEREKTGCDRT